ncbi:MAG: 16S rRNA (guanine(527)-N(7))-methyltransferase RsmG [Erythrobacter sp.]|uniref:16S rRNA (guanine(527)-N(7))-methyltransferase RsmG n=1 Tax=Erythrobacter sp. TaxID=1042 RepID=UPI00261BEFFD|nr:16S rRNA (guanine(527)-N(7))-methyltransferase RsmG [Erythrobacter sp.]MDJ0978470.1 16S rRNA (guanine(527)-N(7))-methyltransferase RsmG [Erythrobacter sp.]
MARLDRFARLLLEENKRQNLISKASEGELWLRHIADSAQLMEHVPRETFEHTTPDPWLDLGTGAGFPGLVIASLRPNSPVALVESRARRVEFLERCVSELGLARCQVLGDRLERIEPFPASVISARAFAPLEKLLRLSARFSTRATRYILPKGRSAAHELISQKKSIRMMFHVEQSLTDCDAGIIVSR